MAFTSPFATAFARDSIACFSPIRRLVNQSMSQWMLPNISGYGSGYTPL